MATMETIPAIPLVCANWVPGTPTCTGEDRKACSNCNLVVYCGKNCQKDHWSAHKKACKSQLSKAEWRPAWDRDGREPSWASPTASGNWHNPFGGQKYLWGNIPAIDVLRLHQNEGHLYTEDIAVLFAASGDLRNVVKTIVDLPINLSQAIQMTINDREFQVVARNAILLLFALSSSDSASTQTNAVFRNAECLIHLWYSAFIPAFVLSQVRTRVVPLIQDVCRGIADKSPGARLAKTWQFRSGRTLRLVLRKEQWLQLNKLLDTPDNRTRQEAENIRKATTLAPERADYRDRWYYKDATPFMRIAKHRFREDGLLLPFGHPRMGFDIPNPTLFQTAETWAVDDKCDPLDGWPLWEVHRRGFLAKEDCYGKLFAYLQDTFSVFLDRLEAANLNFEMYCVDVKALPAYLEREKYSRIEVSNISDAGYVGTRETLALLTPFLQSPQQNPFATLITLFLNAVMEVVKARNEANAFPNLTFFRNYLPKPNVLPGVQPEHNADILRLWDSRCFSLDVEKYFQGYKVLHKFDRISADLQVTEKKDNTIMDQWPMQPKLQSGQEGVVEEFRILLGSNFSGIERYVEWKKTQ